MTDYISDVLPPREALRETIRERLDDLVERLEGGALDGTEVVRRDVLETLLSEPLPPPSSRTAELTTPGEVTVSATCPLCGIPATIVVKLSAELRTDDEGSSLHVKGKSKAATHQCEQQVLSFGLSDIVGTLTSDAAGEDEDPDE